MKTKLACAAVMLTAFTGVAFAESGDFHSKTTDEHGTTKSADTSHSDSVGLTGTRTITEDQTVTTDPKGLMNKTTERAHSKRALKKNGDESLETSTVDENGTQRTMKSSTTTARRNGGYTRTTKHESVVDPKGLMNKRTIEVKDEEKVHGNDRSRTVTKTVDGKTTTVDKTGAEE